MDDTQARRLSKRIGNLEDGQALLSLIKTADGAGSGLDADLLDGLNSTDIALAGTDSNTTVDNIIKPGLWRLGANAGLPPGTNYGQLIVSRGGGNGDTILQIVCGYTSNVFYWRTGNPAVVGGKGAWGAWREVWHSGNAAQSKGANGYCTLPNGIIMQWGTVSITPVANTPTAATVTFPAAFSSATSYKAVPNMRSAVPYTGSRAATVVPASATQMTVYYTRTDAVATNIDWLAIGY